MRDRRPNGFNAAIILSVLFILISALPAFAAHKVKQGDTLWDLAKKYHTTPKALAKANGISETATLGLGKSLRIPGQAAPAKKKWAKAAKATKPVVAKTWTPRAAIYVHTGVESACLRTGASTNQRKIAILPKGATAKLLARRGTWAKVAFGDGTCGYIYRPLLAHGAGSVSYSAESKVERVTAAQAAESAGDMDVVQMALACRGDRYRMGGTSRGGFDCSGFTRYVYAKYGVKLPHSSAAQANVGTGVSRSELQPGDIVCFHTYRRGVSHVGIYIGNSSFVHAATYGRGVRVDSLNSSYYASRYVCARRVK